ncbi:MAG: hypothetical protein NWE95_00645 [Candidatus Bathyarchaeota archaeon]|nr:hypothetical protein [Candidatus Bathyarchaeota archaeon]
MVILVEQVRQLTNESNLIDDSTTYTRSFSRSWGTLKNYGNIVLSANSLVVFSFQLNTSGYNVRLKIGSYYVWGKNNVGTGTFTGIAYVASGTHAVVVEDSSSGAGSSISNFKLGKAKFTDEAGSALNNYSSTINLTVANRSTLPVGSLKNAVFMVRVWAKTAGAQTNFENPGDSLTNGVSLSVDGSQITWTERNQDDANYENASATYYCTLTVGSSHSFAITKDNGSTTVNISVYACPWLLFGSLSEPVAMNFAQNSTLYLMLEPLDLNPTKSVKVGKKRAVSFGDATDYFSSASGTGLLVYSYLFDAVQIDTVSLYVSGLGACISHIGVDVV